eukprot:1440145-Pyramimonas_sp.AAC.1
MLWVLVSIMIFEPVCAGWFERDLGCPLGTVGAPNDWEIINMLWADNVFLFAVSDDQLEIMITEMTTALMRHGFDWKKESLMYMNTVSPDVEGSLVVDNIYPSVELPRVQVMDVLG